MDMIQSIVDRRVALALVTDVADNLSKPIEETKSRKSPCGNVFFYHFKAQLPLSVDNFPKIMCLQTLCRPLRCRHPKVMRPSMLQSYINHDYVIKLSINQV